MTMTKEEKQRKMEEKKWQAQDDAYIMAKYQEILNDKVRMNRALKEAQKQASEMQKRADVMKKIANKKGK